MNWGNFKDKKSSFATAYEWCYLNQKIAIPRSKAKRRLLVIGAICARRILCALKP